MALQTSEPLTRHLVLVREAKLARDNGLPRLVKPLLLVSEHLTKVPVLKDNGLIKSVKPQLLLLVSELQAKMQVLKDNGPVRVLKFLEQALALQIQL